MPKLGRRNERAELDYRVAPDTVLADAPFGTNKTPNIQMRIVGGRYIPVIEQQPRFKDEYVERRIQPLNPITLPPQQTDPRNSLDVSYYKDAQPTALVNKRPDSKDIARLQYRALPPIQLNRTRNDMSTVFEAEPWTQNKQPSLAKETEYKQNYNPALDENHMMDTPQQKPSSSALHTTQEEERELFKTLPRNVLLPVDAIKLTKEQELTAVKIICRALREFDPRELRDVYIECSQHDRDLGGFCSIEVLDNCLRRHRANLSETLRIVAAQFVDPSQPGKVNYEKVLSFIGSALEMHRKGHLSDDRPRYYMQNGEDGVKTGSIYKDREVAKLLRMVEQELSKSTYTMDWTRWRNLFHEKDRDHRETLSGPQIKDICYDCHLPLSDSLINQILSLCEDNNRDGQYRWLAFLDFLSRVRPSNTGLPIPRKDGYSPRREPSPRRGDYYKPEPKQPQYDERRAYSPDKNANHSERPPAGQPRFESPRPRERYDRSPSPVRDRYRPYVEPRDYDRNGDDYRQYRQEPSGGYKASWQERDQRQDDRKWAHAPQEKDRQREIMSPKWTQAPDRDKQESSQNYPEQQYGRDRKFQEGTRYLNPDPYDRAMRAWLDPHRTYNSRFQAPGRLNRPQSYAEPQRTRTPLLMLRRPRPLSYRDMSRYEQQQYRGSPAVQRPYGDESYRRGREERPQDPEEKIRQLTKELEGLQSKYNFTRESLKISEKPWLDRYLKLAQALYNIDIHNTGCLPRTDVMDIVRQYNDAYNLKLDMTRANMLAISPENLDRSGNVLLRPFLASLCGDNFKQRI